MLSLPTLCQWRLFPDKAVWSFAALQTSVKRAYRYANDWGVFYGGQSRTPRLVTSEHTAASQPALPCLGSASSSRAGAGPAVLWRPNFA
jgi:hypothetical protein